LPLGLERKKKFGKKKFTLLHFLDLFQLRYGSPPKIFFKSFTIIVIRILDKQNALTVTLPHFSSSVLYNPYLYVCLLVFFDEMLDS